MLTIILKDCSIQRTCVCSMSTEYAHDCSTPLRQHYRFWNLHVTYSLQTDLTSLHRNNIVHPHPDNGVLYIYIYIYLCAYAYAYMFVSYMVYGSSYNFIKHKHGALAAAFKLHNIYAAKFQYFIKGTFPTTRIPLYDVHSNPMPLFWNN